MPDITTAKTADEFMRTTFRSENEELTCFEGGDWRRAFGWVVEVKKGSRGR
jgi:hypothetical protein